MKGALFYVRRSLQQHRKSLPPFQCPHPLDLRRKSHRRKRRRCALRTRKRHCPPRRPRPRKGLEGQPLYPPAAPRNGRARRSRRQRLHQPHLVYAVRELALPDLAHLLGRQRRAERRMSAGRFLCLRLGRVQPGRFAAGVCQSRPCVQLLLADALPQGL